MCVYTPLCSWCSLFDSRWIVHQDICVWFHVYVYRIATFRLPLMGTWKYNIFSSVILALWLYFSDAILTVVLSVWRSRLLFLKSAKLFSQRTCKYYFPAYSTINLFFFLNLISLVDDNQQSVWPFYLGLFGLESACIKSLWPSSSYQGSIIFVGILFTRYCSPMRRWPYSTLETKIPSL